MTRGEICMSHHDTRLAMLRHLIPTPPIIMDDYDIIYYLLIKNSNKAGSHLVYHYHLQEIY